MKFIAFVNKVVGVFFAYNEFVLYTLVLQLRETSEYGGKGEDWDEQEALLSDMQFVVYSCVK